MLYNYIIRPILFRFDAESVHDTMTKLCIFLGKHEFIKKIISYFFVYRNSKLNIDICGIDFENPIGLAAGFDKNANLIDFMPCIGFGFIEVGSVTGEKCLGNPRPRLFRLPKDKTLVINYGLCNDGAEFISKKLTDKKCQIKLGVSVAKTNDPNIKGRASIMDYVKAFRLLSPIGDYTTINISCPNSGDGRIFCEDPILLDSLLAEVGKEIDKLKVHKPIFLKLKPDLDKKSLDKLLKIVGKYKFVSGFIISNLTRNRAGLKTNVGEVNKTKGSLSGKPVEELSNKMIEYVYSTTKGRYTIIGCGGVFSAEDAYKKIKLGSSLIQLITGMVYEGPALIKNINKGLVKLLAKDGYNSIKEAVGVNISRKWK